LTKGIKNTRKNEAINNSSTISDTNPKNNNINLDILMKEERELSYSTHILKN